MGGEPTNAAPPHQRAERAPLCLPPQAAAASPGEVRRALDCVRLAEEGIEPAHAPLAACAAAAVCAASDQGVGGCPLREALPQSEPAPLEPEWLTQASDELRASPVLSSGTGEAAAALGAVAEVEPLAVEAMEAQAAAEVAAAARGRDALAAQLTN